ncbi:MAG: hypothetical protein JST46_04335 [Bacteroidetes bacterium]|nr:hypothetical protein [Bacteroidota bacterium]
MAKSFSVYPGDVVGIQAYAKYAAPSGTASNLTAFASALLSAFSLTPPGGGEVNTARAAINGWGSLEASGNGDGSNNSTDPKVFVTILMYDLNYNFLDLAYSQLGSSGFLSASYTAREPGYAYVYVSNEHPTLVDVYFDDITISYTPGPILQSNEYYPFGMQTARSWTRPAVTANNFLANGGTEYNASSSLYDLDFRNYDPILGRLTQVDPMSAKYAGMSPYHFAFNNPATFNDPGGADPEYLTTACYTAGMPWSHDYITGRPANNEGSMSSWNPDFYGPALMGFYTNSR